MLKHYSKQLNENSYFFYSKDKKDFILIQELLFKLGYRWISQYTSEIQSIKNDYCSNTAFLIMTKEKQIYQKYYSSKINNKHSIISSNKIIDLLKNEIKFLEQDSSKFKNKYILHSF